MNVLIAGHDIVRQKLMPLLLSEFGELVVRQAKDAHEAMSGFADGNWDLIFLDIRIPGPDIAQVLKQMRKCNPKVPVLVLAGLSDAEHTLGIGASSHSTARPVSSAFVEPCTVTVKGVHEGSKTVRAIPLPRGGGERPGSRHNTLSVREFEVFCLVAEGKATKEIAFDLLVSAKTVATYLARIKEKTGLDNRVDIARYAFQNGLVR